MLNQIQKSKVLILGFGIEGQATLRFLMDKFPEKEFWVADRLKITNDKLRITNKNIKFNFGLNYLKTLNQYDLIIKSPGIKPDLPELVEFKKHGGKITSATNIFMSQTKGTVIGVTGSKGKSTVSSITYEVLKAAGKKVYLIGNIGNPALDELPNDSEETFYVYEMSSYQLEDLEYQPQYAIITNLFPEHLDYHGSLETYYAAKLNIINHNTVVYNANCQKLVELISQKESNKIPFNNNETSKITGEYLIDHEEKIIEIKDIHLLGKHNLENILSVIALSKELGVKSNELRTAIQNFKNLEHRLEYVGEFNHIHFYNDAISTTPESTIQAIEALGDKINTIIVGGLDRGYDFSELAKSISKSSIQNLILFPETGEKIKKALLKLPTTNHQLHTVTNMQDCVKIAFKITKKNKICLLSPASPSYNLFKNFQERGSLYKNFIQKT